jgi:hypothetical protein
LELNQEVVTEYAEQMAEGDVFPVVIVFQDGANYWLADGSIALLCDQEEQRNEDQCRCSGWD